MKAINYLIAAAIILSGCAQKPTNSSQPAFHPEQPVKQPLSQAQQERVKQFEAAHCDANNTPTYSHQFSVTTFKIVSSVESYSYVKPRDIPEYSEKVFAHYLHQLDQKNIDFLASDIESLNAIAPLLWPSLTHGNARLGFCIFQQHTIRKRQSLESRLNYLNNQITEQDLYGHETIFLRNQNSPRFHSLEEKNAYLQKEALYEVLVKMANDTPFQDARNQLILRYQIQLKRLDEEETANDIFEIYINSFLSVVDTHTQYFAPKVSEKFSIDTAMKLKGIGVVLQQSDEGTKVVSTVPGGPSDGKLKPGDIILAIAENGIDYEPIAGWRLDRAIELIRGPKDSYVSLEVQSGKRSTDIVRLSILRDDVKLQDRSVESEIISTLRKGKTYRIGIVHIPTFYADLNALRTGAPNARSTTRDLVSHIHKLKLQNVSGLVIDLMHNGGGSLHEANFAASHFVPNQPTLIIDTNARSETLTSSDESNIFSGPVIVLVDDRSAGASEILAAALQDYDAAIIVGETTFGMGSVATMTPLSQNTNSSLKISIAQYFRATGKPFWGMGVTPDISLPAITAPERESLPPITLSNNHKLKNVSKSGDLDHIRNELKKRSASRQKRSPAFTYIQQTRVILEKVVDKNEHTLNLIELKNEINASTQKSEQLFDAYKKADTVPAQYDSQAFDSLEKHIWLNESAELIVDWLELK